MNWIIRQTIDLTRGFPPANVWPDVLMIPGDGDAHVWEIAINERGQPANLDGYSVSALFVREDKNSIYIAGNSSGNIASVTLTQQCYAIAGQLRGIMRISKNGNVLSACETFFSVREPVPNQYIDPGEIIPSLEELLAQMDALEQLEEDVSAAEAKRIAAEQEREAAFAQFKADIESGEYDGATFTPAVSTAGVISWTNNKGLANPASVNIKGPQGPAGPTGAKGDKGDKGDTGDSGVYLGSTEPADETVKVWINPDGESTPILDDDAVGTKPWSSKQIIDTLCPPLEVAGNPVQCYPVANYPLGVTVSWEPRQEGTGDPSPENVRPIVGMDEVRVQQSKRNLMPYTKPSTPVHTSNGVTFTWNDDGSIHVSGTASKTSTSNVMNFENFFVPPGNYRMIASAQSGVTPQFVVKKASTGDNYWYGYYNISIEPGDVPQYFYVSISDGTVVDDTIYAFLSYGTDIPSADDYAPYTGTTATLALPETIYGGELDAVTGEGSEEWSSVIDLSSSNNLGILEDFANETTMLYYVTGLNNMQNAMLMRCSHLPTTDILNSISTNIGIFGNPVGTMAYIRLSKETASNLNEFRQWVDAQAAAGTPVQITYKLATPTTFQATGGQSLPALPGTNTIYTDADSVTVTGRADPNHTINALNERIAALEDAATGG